MAVVDSGCDPCWRDPRILQGLDATQVHSAAGRADDCDRIGHGTACAELILRQAEAAEILPVRIFGSRLETSVPILVRGIDLARQHGAEIIHLSLGTHLETAIGPLYAACERARRAGIVVVAAAHSGTISSYPAVFDNTLGVAVGEVPGTITNPITFAGIPTFCDPYRAVECVAPAPTWVRGLAGFHPAPPTSSFAAPGVTALVVRLLEIYPRGDLDTGDLDTVRGLLAAGVPRPRDDSQAR